MASSIALFQNVLNFFDFVGILPPTKAPGQTTRWFNAKILFFFFSFMRMSISAISFCIFQADSTFEYAVTNYVFVSELACTFYFSVQICKINDIIKLIENFENFIRNRLQHDPINQSKYTGLQRKIEWMSKMINFILVKIASPGLILPALLLTVINYYIYDMGDESFCLPCPLMLPFNWRTSWGYLMAMCIEWMAVFSIIKTTIPLVCFAIGSCWLFIAFADDITNELSALNISKLRSKHGRVKIKRSLCHIAGIHAHAKQFIAAFNAIYGLMVPGVYLWLLSTFCVIYLMIDYDYNLAELTVTSMVCLWSIVLTFAQCAIGDEVSEQFQAFGMELQRCNWYLFSNDAQRMFAVILGNAQQPAVICGFANTKFTNDSYKKAFNGGFSLLLIFYKIYDHQSLQIR